MNPGHQDQSLTVKTGKGHFFLLYGLCTLLVFSFVLNTFGKTFVSLSPFLLPLLCSVLLLRFCTREKLRTVRKMQSWPWICCGVLLILIALFLPDPRFSVKRIHVTEYLLLSLLVRYTLAHRLSGFNLLFFGVLLTSLMGIHDEFLQGLHPSRTYGLRDIAVNSLSALGGSLIWYALQLFDDQGNHLAVLPKTDSIQILYLLWLVLVVIMMIVAFGYFKYTVIPPWVVLPLGSSLIFWNLYFVRHRKTHHGIAALSYTAFVLFIYPVIINGFQVRFH